MKSNFLSFVLLSCFVVFTLISLVSAQLPNFKSYFDRKFYDLGSTGIVTFDVKTFDESFDISMIGVTLFLPKNDGALFETEFFGENYGENPLQIPADTQLSLSFSFKIPERTDLISGFFSYYFEMDIRPQNTTTYSHEAYGPEVALAYGENCILYVPESIPSPSPIIGPTPTPVPTTTPPSTPTPEPNGDNQPAGTITLTSTEVALIATIIIATVFAIVAVWALKRK